MKSKSKPSKRVIGAPNTNKEKNIRTTYRKRMGRGYAYTLK